MTPQVNDFTFILLNETLHVEMRTNKYQHHHHQQQQQPSECAGQLDQ